MTLARGRLPALSWPALVCALGVAACTPTFDWREVRIENGALTALFPCKPERRTRAVSVAGQAGSMQMLVCAASGSTFAVSFFDVADPAEVSSVLTALRATLVSNLNATTRQVSALALRGSTPNPLASRVHVLGRFPDGQPVEAHAAFFVHGLRVYQASVIGPAPDVQALAQFVDGLKLTS